MNLAPVEAAIAGLRLWIFRAKSAYVARPLNTAALPMRGFLDRPVPESVIKQIGKQLAKSSASLLDPAHGLLHI